MTDKYELLQQNPHYCTRLFGIKFEQFENILEKVQKKKVNIYLKILFLIED
jgi:hypothetical protein